MELKKGCIAEIQRALDLLLTDVYFLEYYEVMQKEDTTSSRQGWEILEDRLLKLSGRNRFSSYEVFQRQRWRYLQNSRKK